MVQVDGFRCPRRFGNRPFHIHGRLLMIAAFAGAFIGNREGLTLLLNHVGELVRE